MVLTLCTASVQAADQRLLIIGDSLSDAYDMPRESGWAYLLGQRLGADWEVVNAAISGETTAGAVYRLPQLLESNPSSHVLIILGGNDGLRALSPAQVRENLQSIIDQAAASGAAVALMQIRLPASLGPVYLRRFESIYAALAEANGVTLLPFFLESIFDEPGMIMADGIHPTESAQPRMLDAIEQPLIAWLGAGP
jgi:acyl-CoA thioesterase-1